MTLLAQLTRKLKKRKNSKQQTNKQKQKKKSKLTKNKQRKMEKNSKNKISYLLYQMIRLKASLML